MSRFRIVLSIFFTFAVLSTFLLAFEILGVGPSIDKVPSGGNSTAIPPTQGQPITPGLPFIALQTHSFIITPVSWAIVAGMWIWRGTMKSRWTKLGLTRETFNLLARMKGSRTRVSMLKALTVPKDRLQLANELNLDWKTVDYHIRVLLKNGLVHEQAAYGNVKLYDLTPVGSVLLKILDELAREEDAASDMPHPN